MVKDKTETYQNQETHFLHARGSANMHGVHEVHPKVMVFIAKQCIDIVSITMLSKYLNIRDCTSYSNWY